MTKCMCLHKTCKLQMKCARHTSSGAKGDPLYQRHALYEPDSNGNCEYFRPTDETFIKSPTSVNKYRLSKH